MAVTEMSSLTGSNDFPRVHVIVVHHRGHQILSRCIETLLSSTGIDLRIAVVANACIEPLPPLTENHPQVLLLRTETPLGFGAANNWGSALLRERAGRPEFLYFLNDDTVSEPGALPTLVEHMKQTPTCAVVGPRLMIQGSNEIVNSLGLDVAVTGEAWDVGLGLPVDECGPLDEIRPVLAVTGTALLVREDVFDRLGGWREIFHYYYEDIDFCLRAHALGGEVEVVTGAVVHHLVSATAQRDSDFKRYHMLRNRLLLIALHWPISLLLRTLPGVLVLEFGRLMVRLGRGRWRLAWVQTLALAGFLRRFPAALWLRRQNKTMPNWTAFLKQSGVIPASRLPAVGAVV